MKFLINRIILHIILVIPLTASSQNRNISYMTSGGPLKPLQAIMDIRHYTIALDINIDKQRIDGYAEIDFVLSQNTDTLLFDLVHLLTVSQIYVDNRAQKFVQQNDLIYIFSPKGYKAGSQKIKISYGGVPPVAVNPPWNGGFSWKQDSTGNPWVVINCQLEGGKVYFPCKDHPSDEPNEGADLFITVPKGLQVAGPGLLQNVKTTGDKQTFHWKTNYTISNYCILFDIGKYELVRDTYTTVLGNKVPMVFYVLEEDKAYAEKILAMRKRDTRILEKYFGEYPWVKEKIGIAQVPNPGMEHQTMITYGDKTGEFNFAKIGNEDYSANLFHEFTHEWFANKVTNKDWAHMWIQEGITTYGEALFCREVAGEKAYDSMIVLFRTRVQNKKPIVPSAVANSGEVYTGDIYTKGAFFMHTLRYMLGDNVFFSTLKKLATDSRFTYDNFVTTDDVEQLFSKESGLELKPIFDFYLRTTKTIDVNIHQVGYNGYLITIANPPMPLPFEVSTDKGIERIIINNDGLFIKSSTLPVVDGKGNYLKTVTIN